MSFPIPATPILDDFNRADEDPLSGGGNWINLNTSNNDILRLISNEVSVQLEVNQTGMMYWTPLPTLTNCESYVTIANNGLETDAYVMARIQNAGGANTWDGYLAAAQISDLGIGNIFLMKMTDGLPVTLIANTSQILNDGDILLLRCIDTNLQVWTRKSGSWNLLLAGVDSTYAWGYIGIGALNNNAAIALDNFGGGTLEPDTKVYFSPSIFRSYGG